MQEIENFPHLREEDRPEVEWMKAPAPRAQTVTEEEGYAVNVGDGHYVKVDDPSKVDLIIEDGSIPGSEV